MVNLSWGSSRDPWGFLLGSYIVETVVGDVLLGTEGKSLLGIFAGVIVEVVVGDFLQG